MRELVEATLRMERQLLGRGGAGAVQYTPEVLVVEGCAAVEVSSFKLQQFFAMCSRLPGVSWHPPGPRC